MMKTLILCLLTLTAYSIFAEDDWVEKSDIAEAVDSARIKRPETVAHDAAVVKIQIDADEAHSAFISEPVSRESMYTLTGSVQIFRMPGRSILFELLTTWDNVPSAEKWSKAIAENKYAVGKKRLELPRMVIQAAIEKGWFKANTSLLACEKGNAKVMSVDGETLQIGFYPELKVNGQLFRAGASTVAEGNALLEKYVGIVVQKVKEANLPNVSGIVFAFTKNGKALQSCEISIPREHLVK
jgi:hypothetical protein